MSSISDFSNPWLLRHTKLEGISLMDHLYNRLNGIYPNKFRSNFRDKQAIEDWKQAWAEAFDEEGVSPNDVALGIKNCRRMFDWPPACRSSCARAALNWNQKPPFSRLCVVCKHECEEKWASGHTRLSITQQSALDSLTC